MARAFDDGSSQFLEVNTTPVTGPPLSMACWFNSDDVTAHQTLMAVYRRTGATNNYEHQRLMIRGNQAGDPVAASTQSNASGYDDATTTTGYSANTWHHACGVWAAVNDRRAYIDGGSKGTDSASNTPLDATRILISHVNSDNGTLPTQYMSGNIAEAAIWNASLTDAEAAVLAEGTSPLLVRPGSLVAYWPLIRDTDDDLVGTYSMTPNGGPTIAVHPRVLYAAREQSAPLRVIPDAEIVWGHDTGVAEATVRNFLYNWTGTGTVINGGVADTERIDLSAGEYMISEVVDTGAVNVEILYNVYTAGDTIDLDYRTGASRTACQAAAWNNYVSGFLSSGYVQIRVTSTL